MARRDPLHRLDSVIRIAADEEQKALAALVQCREERASQEQKLKNLQAYEEEYQEQMRAAGTISPLQIQNRFAFMQKLEFAIDGQRQQIESWAEQEEQLRRVWLEKRVRCRALNKASDNRRESFQRQQRHQEQKQADDLGNRRRS